MVRFWHPCHSLHRSYRAERWSPSHSTVHIVPCRGEIQKWKLWCCWNSILQFFPIIYFSAFSQGSHPPFWSFMNDRHFLISLTQVAILHIQACILRLGINWGNLIHGHWSQIFLRGLNEHRHDNSAILSFSQLGIWLIIKKYSGWIWI